MSNLGQKVWFIPDGYYPPISTGNIYVSHEAICVLNVGTEDAVLNITLYFEDRDKMTGFQAVCKAERTNHIRMDKMNDKDGNGVPIGVPYAILVESSTDIIVQYSRLDTTQAEIGLMTTMAYSAK